MPIHVGAHFRPTCVSNEPVSQDAAYCICSILSCDIPNMIKLFSLTSFRYLTSTLKFKCAASFNIMDICGFRSFLVRCCPLRQLCRRGECLSKLSSKKWRTNSPQSRTTNNNSRSTDNHPSSSRNTGQLSRSTTSGPRSLWKLPPLFPSSVSTRSRVLMEATRQREYYFLTNCNHITV